MTALVRAAAGATIVLSLPGALIASLLRMRFSALTTWAAIPVFSVAAVFVLGEITNLIHVPFGVPAFAALVAALALGAFARRQILPGEAVGNHSGPQAKNRAPWRNPEHLAAHCLLAIGIAVGTLTWARGLNGMALGPASNDGAHHAYFVARILNTQAFDLSKVLVADPIGQVRTLKFYPLGTHASATIATRLVDADIGRMLIVFMVLFAAVVLPLGIFALARTLAPHRPLIAGFSAVIVPALSMFPYAPSTWGAVALIVGMAMVPITVVIVTHTVIDRETPLRMFPRFITGLVPAALALLSAISVHSSQLPLIVFLVTLLVVERAWRNKAPTLLLNALVRGAFAMLLMLVLFAPTLVDTGGGVSERASLSPAETTNVDQAIRPILTLYSSETPGRQVALAAFALVGACIWLITTRRLAWVIGWVTILAVTLLATTSRGTISQALTLPWYHIPQRINYNQVFFVAFFAAVPFAFAVTGTVHLLRSRRWLLPATAVGAAVFVASVGFHGYRNATVMLHGTYTNKGVRPASLQAYAWLARHADARDAVVHDADIDGSLWMYPYAGVNPLFGFPATMIGASTSSLSDQALLDERQRVFLLNNIALVGRDPSVDALARALHARWIYFDERTYPHREHTLDLDAIRRNPNLVEVFNHRTVHVFKITLGAPVVDREPPTTSILRPGETQLASSISGRILLAAGASDDVRVSKVEFYATGGGVLSDTFIGAARRTYVGWLYRWATTSVPNGTYILTSVAFDLAGNSGRSASVSITVQN
jgi:hypothetical protein